MTIKDNQKVFFGKEKVSKSEKQKGVNEIFSKVTSNYDLMNDFMSLGAHRLWKNTFVKEAKIVKNSTILDLAGGTGDITKIIQKKYYNCKVYLSDQNSSMVNFARDRAMNEGFINNTFFDTSSAEKLPFKNSFFNL